MRKPRADRADQRVRAKKLATTRAEILVAVRPLFGIWSDQSIATSYGLDRSVVTRWRMKEGAPAYPSDVSLAHATEATIAKGKTTAAAVLEALFTRQGTRCGEITRRVNENIGKILPRQISRHLQKLVAEGKVIREGEGRDTMYRRVA